MNDMDGMRAAEASPDVEELARRLLASANVCDRRKGRDLGGLLALSQGLWKGRVRIEGLASGPARSLVVISSLEGTRSLLWAGEPRCHDRWRVALSILHDYPLSRPEAAFLKPLPFNPHVVHGAFAPSVAGLPPELQVYVRNASFGACCYLSSDQWRISRLLAGPVRAEDVSLNRTARDFLLRSGDTLDLGPPLPCPPGPSHLEGVAAPCARVDGDSAPAGDAVAWVASEQHETRAREGDDHGV